MDEPRSVDIRPTKIRLEVSSRCQLRCPSCPTTTGAINPAVGSGVLRLSDFRRLIDENPSVRTIELSNYGEIFLNPDLLGMLEYAHGKGVALECLNGANLNHARPEVLEGLVRFRLQALRVSIDGASAETYARYRVRGRFERVIENVRTINRHKLRMGSPYPRLVWQFIVFGHNEHEIPAARRMAGELGMEFEPKLSWDEELSPVRDPEAVKRMTGLAEASRSEHVERTGLDYFARICEQLWTEPQVNWDGKVLGCCRNFWGEFGGNVFDDGLDAGVNSEGMRYARAMLAGEAPARAGIPCTTCSVYHQRAATGTWLTAREPGAGG